MADDTVQVRLGADVSDAKSGMADASSSIQSSLNGIQSAISKFGSTNKETVDQAIQNNANLSRSFLELKASTTSGFNAITGVIERFRGVLGTLAAALAGGALFKGSVDAMLRLEDEVRGLEIVFGTSAEQATQMAVQLRVAGVSVDSFEHMATKVGLVMRTLPEQFTRFGVAIKDSNGALLPMDKILSNIYDSMQTFKAGGDQDIVAMNLLGRSALGFASDMQRFRAAQDDAAEALRRLGIEMGPDRQAQVEQYRRSVNIFGLELSTIGERIGEAVLPRLEGLAQWFNSIGPTAIEVVVVAVKGLVTVLESLGALVASVAIVAVAGFKDIAIGAAAAWQTAKAAASGNFGVIPGIVSDAMEKIKAENSAAGDSVIATWDRATKRVNDMWANAPPPTGLPSAVPKSGSKSAPLGPLTRGENSIAALENQLRAEQDAFNKRMLQQGSFQTWSVEQTRDYWQNVLALTNLSVKQRQDAENKYYDAERQVQQRAFAAYLGHLEDEKAALGHNIEAKIAIEQKEYAAIVQRYGAEAPEAAAAYKRLVELRQQLADQRNRIADIEQKQQEATYKHEISMAKLAADQGVALKQISATQRLAIEKDFITKEYQAEVDGINARIAAEAADPNSDPVKMAALKGELLKIEQDYQTQLTKIDNAAVLEREKYAIQAQDAITSSISNTLAALVSGTKNWKQTLMDAFKALDDELVKIAANKITEQLFGAGTAGGGFLSQITGAIFGGGGGQAVAQAANTTAVTALTAAVTANTAALAASGAGSLFGGGGGLGDLFGGGGGSVGFDVPFFDVGTPYVPQDTLAVVHRGEAIIPAAYNRGGTNGGAGGGVVVHNHFMLTGPIDTRTQTQIAASASIGARRGAARNL